MMSTTRDAVPSAPLDAMQPKIVACPVCGSTSFRARFEAKGAIEACDRCGLVLQNPQPSDRELAAIYGSNYFIGSSAEDALASQFELVKRATARLQLEEIVGYLARSGRTPAGLRLIEIGCGHGNMLLEARASGFAVQGLEFSADAANTANRKLGTNAVQVGAIETSRLPEAAYDVCVLADVIEHVRDPRDFLMHTLRILKDGATIYIATPSLDSWSARALGRHWMEFKREHLFYFNGATIAELLTDVGFSDIQITPGVKILTPDYIIGHFEKFPVPIISSALRVLRKLVPDGVRGKPIKVTASGINVLATKS
jgi:2-polyprenyl-3-methyl-5-hydroxy-6-metoxy-1,4-benzoquinol methylase